MDDNSQPISNNSLYVEDNLDDFDNEDMDDDMMYENQLLSNNNNNRLGHNTLNTN